MSRIRGDKPVLFVDSMSFRDELLSCEFVPQTISEPVLCGPENTEITAWTLEGEAVQSMQPGSLWRMMWDRAGEIVSFRYAPFGDATPTEHFPHLIGMLRIPARASFGGEASVKTSHTFSFSCPLSDGPELISH